MTDMLQSKKFRALIVGIIAVIIVRFIPGITEDVATQFVDPIVAMIISYIVGQGLADFGKEAVKNQ